MGSSSLASRTHIVATRQPFRATPATAALPTWGLRSKAGNRAPEITSSTKACNRSSWWFLWSRRPRCGRSYSLRCCWAGTSSGSRPSSSWERSLWWPERRWSSWASRPDPCDTNEKRLCSSSLACPHFARRLESAGNGRRRQSGRFRPRSLAARRLLECLGRRLPGSGIRADGAGLARGFQHDRGSTESPRTRLGLRDRRRCGALRSDHELARCQAHRHRPFLWGPRRPEVVGERPRRRCGGDRRCTDQRRDLLAAVRAASRLDRAQEPGEQEARGLAELRAVPLWLRECCLERRVK